MTYLYSPGRFRAGDGLHATEHDGPHQELQSGHGTDPVFADRGAAMSPAAAGCASRNFSDDRLLLVSSHCSETLL